MHCTCCNALLSDYESTRKNAITGEYIDLCNDCFSDLKNIVPTKDRKDLLKQSDIDDLMDDFDEDVIKHMRWSDDSF